MAAALRLFLLLLVPPPRVVMKELRLIALDPLTQTVIDRHLFYYFILLKLSQHEILK